MSEKQAKKDTSLSNLALFRKQAKADEKSGKKSEQGKTRERLAKEKAAAKK